MAAYQPLRVGQDFFRGEDKAWPFTIRDGATGGLRDITGWTVTFTLFTKQGSPQIAVLPATITDGLNGECEVDFATADTSALTPGRKWYTLARTDGGHDQVMAFGDFELKAR